MEKKINIIFLIIWMILIFIMSNYTSTASAHQSGLIVNVIASIFKIDNLNLLSHIIRKLAHFTEYFILGILTIRVIIDYKLNNYYAIIICILYAISDEIHQIFIPGRSGEVRDVLIDITGTTLGIIIYNLYHKNKK